MQRYELSEGTSNKFWEVAVTGAELRVRFGKIGSAGQTQIKQLGSPAAAEAAMAKLVAEKVKKGYALAGGKGEGKAGKAPAPKAAAAAPAAKPSGVKPTALAITKLGDKVGDVHRMVVSGQRVLATGNRCYASSDGKTFHRRESPGTSYVLEYVDGAAYSLGGPYAVSRDWGATWKQLKRPLDGYILALFQDGAGTWWMGGGNGEVLTSSHPERGWKAAPFESPGKVLHFAELDGTLFVMGAGSGTWDGTKWRVAKELKGAVITRIREAPSGALVCHGDGGVIFRSTDRGASWKKVRSGVDADLEDSAWVAGALFVVGAYGTLLRSLDEGKTFTQVPIKTQKLWTIASWGDGALLGGDAGVYKLAAPSDPYWRGAKDEMAPPPIEVDASFEPRPSASTSERDKRYATLHAAAVAEHAKLSAKLRDARPADANPKLAAQVDEGGDDAMLVYADWLVERGDPRGELAQLQLRLAAEPSKDKRKELKKAEQALLKQHGATWLGKLAGYEDVLELEWRAGFIYKARLANTHDRSSEFGEPKKPEIELEKLLAMLLAEPSARFLRELVVGIVTFTDNDYSGIAKVLGKHYLPALRRLFLGDFHSEETELNWSTLGNLAPMYAALPNLRSLTIRSGSMTLGSVVLPELEELEVITGGLDRKAAKAIATARCPGLRSLTVQIGSENYDADAGLKDLQPILDGAGLPRLERLGLTNNEITDQLIVPLAGSKILPQLSHLSLALGTMGDEGAAAMFRLQRAFAHLASIDLDDNFITADGKRLLAKAKLPIEWGSQRDDGGNPEDRYCAAGE